MKGIIVYSSLTGNTKRMAEHIHEFLNGRDELEVEICDIKEGKQLEDYDFALVGGWVDKGMPNRGPRNLLKSTKQNNLGAFVTLGAMPDSEHGLKVEANMKKILSTRNSLGDYRCPGIVDPKLIEKMRGFTGKIVPAKIRDKMIKSGEQSRWATEEELQKAAEYFLDNIMKAHSEGVF